MIRWTFPAFAAVMLLLPLLPVPDFWITQSNYIGLYALVALGLVLLTGVAGLTSFGQAAFVGVGAYTAAYLATQSALSPLADAVGRRGAGSAGRAAAGRADAAHVGPLPAAGHHRLGPGAVLHDGQCRGAGQVRRHARHPADEPVRHRPGHRPRLASAGLGDRAAGGAGGDPPARFAPGPRDPRAEERRDHGRGDGHLHLPLQAHGLRDRRGAGGDLGLAVRALPAHRQPLALRHQQGHRIPVHGGAGRRRPCVGRVPRRGRGAPDRRPAAGAAAQAARHQRQLRDHRLRHRAGGGAEVRARRPVELRRPLAPEHGARARLGRRRAAARARQARRAANACSTSRRCASSSAAWWPSTTSAST